MPSTCTNSYVHIMLTLKPSILSLHNGTGFGYMFSTNYMFCQGTIVWTCKIYRQKDTLSPYLPSTLPSLLHTHIHVHLHVGNIIILYMSQAFIVYNIIVQGGMRTSNRLNLPNRYMYMYTQKMKQPLLIGLITSMQTKLREHKPHIMTIHVHMDG